MSMDLSKPVEGAIVQEWRKISEEVELSIYRSWVFSKNMKEGAKHLKQIHEHRSNKLDKIDEGFAFVSELVDEIITEIYHAVLTATNSMVENDETVDFLKLVALVWIAYAVFQMIPASTCRVFELTKSVQVTFQLTISFAMLVLGSMMLYESQRYIHMCTKGKMLLDNPEKIRDYFPSFHEHTLMSNWPNVCIGSEGTGHLLDLVPGKYRQEFETGMSIFKAFYGRIEDFTHEKTKFEPTHLKNFAFALDSMNDYDKSELQYHHKSFRYRHSVNELNHIFRHTKYKFGLKRSDCPSGTVAPFFPVSEQLYTDSEAICVLPKSIMNSKDQLKDFIRKDGTVVEAIESSKIHDWVDSMNKALPEKTDMSKVPSPGDWLLGHFRCISSHEIYANNLDVAFRALRKRVHSFFKQISNAYNTYYYIRKEFTNSFNHEKAHSELETSDRPHHNHSKNWRFSHSSLNCRSLKKTAMRVLKGACYGEIYGRMSTFLAISSWILGVLGLLSSVLSIFELVIGKSSGAEMRKWM